MPLEPPHVRVIGIAMALPETRTAALAGGGAMLAHGIVERATKDIDLFTDRDADEAIRIVAALRIAVQAAGLRVEPAHRPPHENRFVAVDATTGRRSRWRCSPTADVCTTRYSFAVGPVLLQDDLAADKTLAMWGRGEPGDFLDVNALLQRYDHGTLFELARSKDRGLTVDTFVVSLRGVRRLGDEDWADAGIEPTAAAAVRRSILDWADRLAP